MAPDLKEQKSLDPPELRKGSGPFPKPQSEAFERHWSVAELAILWNLSEDAVRRLFANEPGVFHIGNTAKGRMGRRTYTTLRMPESVVERVHKRRCLVK
jgi:hypothetical protein